MDDKIFGYVFGVYAERSGMVSRWLDNKPDIVAEEEMRKILKVLTTIEDFCWAVAAYSPPICIEL